MVLSPVPMVMSRLLNSLFAASFSVGVCRGLFGLVSLFNGISTFLGYLMPKSFSLKNSSGTGRIRRFLPFPRVFVRK